MSYGNKTSLIIGADGFLGANLVAYFQRHGWPCLMIGKADGDLSKPTAVAEAFARLPPVDRIFHVVTRQRTGTIQYRIQGEMLAINARIHLNILEAWRRYQPGAKMVSVGSSCAYPELDRPLTEDLWGTGRVHSSVKGYALAKQMLATGCECFAEQYNMKYLYCVLATMFGPHDNKQPDRSHFMGAMIDRAVREKRENATAFTVWGNPGTVRELVYVEDQIEAILAADQAFENELLNTAANMPVTVSDVAKAVLEGLDWSASIYTPPDSFQGAGYKVLNSSRFLERTGWAPRISLVDGVRRLLTAEYTV
jgi:GDP-L-fucose synthase